MIVNQFVSGGNTAVSLNGAVITLNQSAFTYDGTAKEPAVTSVVLNGRTLTRNQDYAVMCDTAVNAGTYHVTIFGVNGYTYNNVSIATENGTEYSKVKLVSAED